MIRLFISYSHADEDLRRRLDVQLAALQRQGIVEVWHDRRVGAGEDFAHAIDAGLASATIVLLLASPDFIASSYCYDLEMREALRRYDAGQAIVIPVIARACDWHHLPLGRLQATPTDGRLIRLFPDLDSAFLETVRDIKSAALRLGALPSLQPGPRRPAANPEDAERPRSENLRVRREFTDFDRDRFRLDAFELIARYFENSLDEPAARNPGFHREFRWIDATAVEAALYDHGGVRRSLYSIWLRADGRGPEEIRDSKGGTGTRSGFNECLNVETRGIARI